MQIPYSDLRLNLHFLPLCGWYIFSIYLEISCRLNTFNSMACKFIYFLKKTLIISIGFTRLRSHPSFSHNMGPKLLITIVVK